MADDATTQAPATQEGGASPGPPPGPPPAQPPPQEPAAETPPPAPEAAAAADALPSDPKEIEALQKQLRKAFKALREGEKRVKAREAELAERHQAVGHLGEIDKLIKDNPAALLERYPELYPALTYAALGEKREPTPEEIAARVVEERLAAERKARQEAEAKDLATREEQQKARVRADVRQLAEANPDKFELVRAFEAYPQAQKVIWDQYMQHGELLTYEQALSHVESVLEKRHLAKLRGLKKLAPQPPSAAPTQQAGNEGPPAGGSITLTNSTPPSTTTAVSNGRASRKESLAKASALLRWND